MARRRRKRKSALKVSDYKSIRLIIFFPLVLAAFSIKFILQLLLWLANCMSSKKKEEAKSEASRLLNRLQISVDIANNTSDPDLFSRHYEKMLRDAKALIAFEGRIRFSGMQPNEVLKHLEEKREEATLAMLDRHRGQDPAPTPKRAASIKISDPSNTKMPCKKEKQSIIVTEAPKTFRDNGNDALVKWMGKQGMKYNLGEIDEFEEE